MNTITTTNHKIVSVETKNGLFNDKFWETIEFSRIGISAMIILITGCMGGIAVGFGMDGSTTQLAMVAFSSIFTLASILGGAPMRVVLGVCSIALFIDITVLIF